MNFRLLSQYHADIKKLIKISLPILLAQIAQNSMGLADTIMAGRVSSTDMAAISIGASIWMPLMFFGQGLLLALPPTISYLNGSGQHHRIAHQVRQGIWLVLGVSIPLGLLIYFCEIPLQYMQMESKMSDLARDYLHAMLWGLPAYLMLINIPLNYIFIYGKFGMPAFGAVGCGIATAIVNWAMCLMMIFYSYTNTQERSLKVFSQLIEMPNPKTLKKLLRLGLPIAIAICCEVALYALTSLMLSPLGATIVASHQITLNTSSFIFMFPMSIGMATTILVGQALGAGSPQNAKKIGYAALLLGLTVTIITALITIFFRYEIASIFVTDEIVIAMAANLLLFAALYQFSDTIQMVVGGILRGYKDTKMILYITLFSYWVIGVPLGYTLGRTDWLVPHIDAKGFWIAFVVSLTFAAFLLSLRMKKMQAMNDNAILQRLEKLK
ncbi:TPA: sodium-coupled multidrug efflux MATE transporter HmrM [Haemophilus influenzae]